MPSPDLSPHALASLVAIAEHGSVSAAARVRRITQPSLSRQIQELERALGVQLIERHRQGARLTPSGEAVAEDAREVLARLAALPARARGRADQVAGPLRLGTVDSIGIHVLPPVLAGFARANPRARVQVVCQSSPQLMDMLLAGELDVAIGTTEHPQLACERLYQNPLVVVVPPGCAEDEIPTSLRALAARPVITFGPGLTVRKLLDQAFAKAGIPFQPVMELANVEVIKAMVRAGLGVGVIPDGCLAGHELQSRPLPGFGAARTIRLMHRPGQQPRAVQTLIEWLRRLRRA